LSPGSADAILRTSRAKRDGPSGIARQRIFEEVNVTEQLPDPRATTDPATEPAGSPKQPAEPVQGDVEGHRFHGAIAPAGGEDTNEDDVEGHRFHGA
jgi:hypothetical protein